MKIFVTGVAGYIGASFAFKMLKDNNQVIGIDNFSNSTKDVIDRLATKFHDDFARVQRGLRQSIVRSQTEYSGCSVNRQKNNQCT